MSGGSWEYVYQRFDETGDQLLRSESAERRALGLLVKAVAKALHDVEWVDSCDLSTGDEVEAIRAALGQSADVAIGRRVAQRLEDEIVIAQDALARLRSYTGEKR